LSDIHRGALQVEGLCDPVTSAVRSSS